MGVFLIHHNTSYDGMLLSWVSKGHKIEQRPLCITLKGGVVEESSKGERYHPSIEVYSRSFSLKNYLPILVYEARMRAKSKKSFVRKVSWEMPVSDLPEIKSEKKEQESLFAPFYESHGWNLQEASVGT